MGKLMMALVAAIAFARAAAGADSPPLTHEIVMNVPAEKVWAVFTTAEGYKNFGVAKAEMDFRVGGAIRSHYQADGVIGDEGTIENTILAYEPMRMVAFKCTKTPKGFPFPEAMAKCWSVAYIEDLGDGRTRLTLKGLGYDDTEQSVKMRQFFDAGNAWSLQMLRARLEGMPPPTTPAHDAANSGKGISMQPVLLSPKEGDGPIEVEAIVNAPIADVWSSWTTAEGIKSFIGREATIELRPGGAYEIYFDDKGSPGQRGSEGCHVLAYEPMRMLSFSWNAPPKLAHCRGERTWVVVTLEEAETGRTRVRLTQHGFAEKIASQPEHAAEWRECRGYFVNAWPRVLGALQARFASPR